jgi:phosphoglycolate phosphatase-like HAD superfamily hydrolase
LKGRADAIVVSQTPTEALVREWEENKIDGLVRLIAGQEHGTKKQHLKMAATGNYEPGHVLMIGDAPGDYDAARANNALFFPINPGHEEASWEQFYKEGVHKFIAGTFAGGYEAGLIAEFEKLLPSAPPWKQ